MSPIQGKQAHHSKRREFDPVVPVLLISTPAAENKQPPPEKSFKATIMAMGTCPASHADQGRVGSCYGRSRCPRGSTRLRRATRRGRHRRVISGTPWTRIQKRNIFGLLKWSW